MERPSWFVLSRFIGPMLGIVNTINHFIWRFVKRPRYSPYAQCLPGAQKYTVYRLDMVAACNGFRMSLENNDDALLLLLARVMIQLGTKDTAYKIQTKYAAAALRTSSKSPILPDLPPI